MSIISYKLLLLQTLHIFIGTIFYIIHLPYFKGGSLWKGRVSVLSIYRGCFWITYKRLSSIISIITNVAKTHQIYLKWSIYLSIYLSIIFQACDQLKNITIILFRKHPLISSTVLGISHAVTLILITTQHKISKGLHSIDNEFYVMNYWLHFTGEKMSFRKARGFFLHAAKLVNGWARV
jgi:hypothetical protein